MGPLRPAPVWRNVLVRRLNSALGFSAWVQRQGGVMGKINMGRVILGGIVAGIVVNILAFLVDGLMLAPQWAEGMRALGKPDFSVNQIIGFNILGFAYGIFTVWLYAAIR